ncbi:hypothetical protein GCM10011614_08490 [Novosphingobium colocasiae]|uniref:Uncharacterized protein n=1 Tax=Novosphingobium colocasiae TaxID=1256513 RepID=A0A918PBJ3_9SPHN|nr:hypothetical protein GCM10011614_08490 [Novosphingobium colocasiae]
MARTFDDQRQQQHLQLALIEYPPPTPAAPATTEAARKAASERRAAFRVEPARTEPHGVAAVAMRVAVMMAELAAFVAMPVTAAERPSTAATGI